MWEGARFIFGAAVRHLLNSKVPLLGALLLLVLRQGVAVGLEAAQNRSRGMSVYVLKFSSSPGMFTEFLLEVLLKVVV